MYTKSARFSSVKDPGSLIPFLKTVPPTPSTPIFEYQELSERATSLAVADRIAFSFADNSIITMTKEANKESVATTSTTLLMGGSIFFMAISGSSGMSERKTGLSNVPGSNLPKQYIINRLVRPVNYGWMQNDKQSSRATSHLVD